MGFNNVDVKVGSAANVINALQDYNTVILKPNIVDNKNVLTQSMMSEKNTKYVIRWNYILKGGTVTVPEDCIVEFAGGTLDNGVIVGNNTRLIYSKPIDEICKAERQGTWIYDTTVADEEDITSVDGHLKFKDRPATDGMGKVILRKNKSFASQVTKPNTIYVIRYDFVLDCDVTIPENCVLEFDGGSIRNGSVVGNILNKYLFPEWFGAVGDGKHDDTEAFNNAAGLCSKIILHKNKTYILTSKYSDNERNCGVIIKRNLEIEGNGSTIKIADNTKNLFSLFLPSLTTYNIDVAFYNINVDFNAENNVDIDLSNVTDRRYFFRCDKIKNFTAVGCKFVYNGSNVFLVRKADSILIDSCSFEWFIVDGSFDNSSITVGTKKNGKGTVSNCYFAPKNYNGELPQYFMFGGVEAQGLGALDIINNTFVGIEKGINVSDIVCCADDESEWTYNNTIKMTGVKTICNNSFTDCRTSIAFWSYVNAIDKIDIKNNYCKINALWYDAIHHSIQVNIDNGMAEDIARRNARKYPQFISCERAQIANFNPQQEYYFYYGKLGHIEVSNNVIVNDTDWETYWNKYDYVDKDRGCVEFVSPEVKQATVLGNVIKNMPGCVFMYGLRYMSGGFTTAVNIDFIKNTLINCVGLDVEESYTNSYINQSVFVYLHNDTESSNIYIDGNNVSCSDIGRPVMSFAYREYTDDTKETFSDNNCIANVPLALCFRRNGEKPPYTEYYVMPNTTDKFRFANYPILYNGEVKVPIRDCFIDLTSEQSVVIGTISTATLLSKTIAKLPRGAYRVTNGTYTDYVYIVHSNAHGTLFNARKAQSYDFIYDTIIKQKVDWKSVGSTRPTGLTSIDAGKQFYDISLGKMTTWNGGRWIDAEGYDVSKGGVARSGTFVGVPTVAADIYEGYMYMINNGTNHFPIYAHIAGNPAVITWYKADGTQYTG